LRADCNKSLSLFVINALLPLEDSTAALAVVNPLSGADHGDEHAILAECERDEDWRFSVSHAA
jgi:hypothetical protein